MPQTMATNSALEERLGIKVMHRTTRRLSLTEAGRDYLDFVECILIEIEEADAKAARDTFNVRGTLRLNAPVSLASGTGAPTPCIFQALLRPHHRSGPQRPSGRSHRRGMGLVVRIGSMGIRMIARRIAPCRTVARRDRLPQETQDHADLARHDCLGYTLLKTVGDDRWFFGQMGKASAAVKGTLLRKQRRCARDRRDRRPGVHLSAGVLVCPRDRTGPPYSSETQEPVELDGIFAAYSSAPSTRKSSGRHRFLRAYVWIGSAVRKSDKGCLTETAAVVIRSLTDSHDH